MNLEQIKQAISDGKTVYWSTLSYIVIKVNNDYFIKNDRYLIGLVWADGKTLNGKQEDFFIK